MMEVLMAGIQKRPEEKVYFSFQWLGSIANSLVTDSGDLAIDWLPLSCIRLLGRERNCPCQVSHAPRLSA